jgi:hypothetical protein
VKKIPNQIPIAATTPLVDVLEPKSSATPLLSGSATTLLPR